MFVNTAVARMSQPERPKITKGGNIFKYNVGCVQQPPRKKSLAIYNIIHTRLIKLYRYGRRTCGAPEFDVLQLGQGKRQEIAYITNH